MIDLVIFGLFGLAYCFKWLFLVISLLFFTKNLVVIVEIYKSLIDNKKITLQLILPFMIWTGIMVLYSLLIHEQVFSVSYYFVMMGLLGVNLFFKTKDITELILQKTTIPNMGMMFIGMVIYYFIFNQNNRLFYLLWIPFSLFCLWYFYFKFLKRLNMKSKVCFIFFGLCLVVLPFVRILDMPNTINYIKDYLLLVSLFIIMIIPHLLENVRENV